jgi:transcription antitermination factor NusG
MTTLIDAESLISHLSRPLDPADRLNFRHAAETALAARDWGEGEMYRTLVAIWRGYFHPPPDEPDIVWKPSASKLTTAPPIETGRDLRYASNSNLRLVAMSYWACAQIQAAREKLALRCLEDVAGFKIYSPRIPAPARARRQGDTDRPLFPGYVFVWIVQQWWQARWSPGVVRLVLDGVVPARVPDQVIDALHKRERNGLIHLPKPRGLQAGDQVRVLGGPFVGFAGLYAGMKPHQRVEVLLALLGGHQRVILSKNDIVPVVF